VVILETILFILFMIVALGLIILTLLQGKDDDGVSGAIMGGASTSFYEKNKGRTKEGMMKRWTIILFIAFTLIGVGLGIVYMMPK